MIAMIEGGLCAVGEELFKNRRIDMLGKKKSSEIKLGDMVIDTITGFQGVVIAEHRYLHGCRRLSIQPRIDKDGKIPDSGAFDEPQLTIVDNAKSFGDTATSETGGPEKYTDAGRQEVARR